MRTPKLYLILSTVLTVAGAGALLIYGGVRPVQPSLPPDLSTGNQPALQITSPTEGAMVAPGQTITVIVATTAGTLIDGGIAILGESPLPASELKTSPPFQFSLTIPTNIRLGKYQITAVGGRKPTLIRSETITLDVEKTDPVTKLGVEPTEIKFSFAGDQMPLRVIGVFADGSISDITKSSKTTYSSGAITVATVDSTGLVTAVGPATTTVVVRYGAQSISVPTSVPQTIPGDLNGDGRVDQDDLNILLDVLNTPAVGPFDARDLNKDGSIDMLDAKLVVTLCTSRCDSINIPPDVTNARPSTLTLWPPDHRMMPVSILGVTDPDGDPLTIRIDRIRQDESTMGLGAGDTCPDGQGVGSSTAQLRAERSGTGNGRVYTVFFTATDARGGNTRGTVQICVPHDQNSTCVFNRPGVDSTVCRP